MLPLFFDKKIGPKANSLTGFKNQAALILRRRTMIPIKPKPANIISRKLSVLKLTDAFLEIKSNAPYKVG
jgi:hypothetical protein